MLEELHVLMEGNDNFINLPAYLLGHTIVELQSCISTDIRGIRGEPQKHSDLIPKSDDTYMKEKLLHDLGSSLEQALDIHKKIMGSEYKKKSSHTRRSQSKQKKKYNDDLFSKNK